MTEGGRLVDSGEVQAMKHLAASTITASLASREMPTGMPPSARLDGGRFTVQAQAVEAPVVLQALLASGASSTSPAPPPASTSSSCGTTRWGHDGALRPGHPRHRAPGAGLAGGAGRHVRGRSGPPTGRASPRPSCVRPPSSTPWPVISVSWGCMTSSPPSRTGASGCSAPGWASACSCASRPCCCNEDESTARPCRAPGAARRDGCGCADRGAWPSARDGSRG